MVRVANHVGHKLEDVAEAREIAVNAHDDVVELSFRQLGRPQKEETSANVVHVEAARPGQVEDSILVLDRAVLSEQLQNGMQRLPLQILLVVGELLQILLDTEELLLE